MSIYGHLQMLNRSKVETLRKKLSSLEETLSGTQKNLADSEKEQEDLLVYLDEMSAKRKRDKVRLREAGLEVSDDEKAENESESTED